MRQRQWHLGVLCTLAAAFIVTGTPGSMRAACAAAATDGVRIYRWTDDQGIVHFGDSVPPQYAESEREVLNAQGIELSHVAGRKSASEISAEASASEQREQRAQHDRFLLATYASAQEIERLRDERLDQITGQIKASSSYIDSLGVRLAALEERAMHFEPYSSAPGAGRMPDELAEELVRTINESRAQRAALDSKRHEQEDMREQFDTDLQRYLELTSGRH